MNLWKRKFGLQEKNNFHKMKINLKKTNTKLIDNSNSVLSTFKNEIKKAQRNISVEINRCKNLTQKTPVKIKINKTQNFFRSSNKSSNKSTKYIPNNTERNEPYQKKGSRSSTFLHLVLDDKSVKSDKGRNEKNKIDLKRNFLKKKTFQISVPKTSSDSPSQFMSFFHFDKPKEIGRKKISKITYDKSWYRINNIPHIPIMKCFVSSDNYQTKSINDEITILIDNFYILKKNFMGDARLIPILEKIPKSYLIKLNMVLEELVVLIFETIKLLLGDYFDEIDRYVNTFPPDIEMFSKRRVTNEINEFKFNIRFLNKVFFFLKGSLEVFDYIMKKHDSFLLSENVFTKVIHFLDRARLNISNLFYSLYNYYKNFVSDSNLVDKYKERMRSRNISYLDQEDLMFYSEPKKQEIFAKKFYTETEDREKRLKLLFFDDYHKNKRIQKKTGHQKSFSLNSPLISRIFKYCNSDFQKKVIAERVRINHTDK